MDKITYTKGPLAAVVSLNGKVVGRIQIYRNRGNQCIVNIPGKMSPALTPGTCLFASLREAKKVVESLLTSASK